MCEILMQPILREMVRKCSVLFSFSVISLGIEKDLSVFVGTNYLLSVFVCKKSVS